MKKNANDILLTGILLVSVGLWLAALYVMFR